LEEEITIVPDPKTYSLVVYASKKNQQWIGSLVRQLDEYRPQVLLDVTLVEITKTDDFNYDLNVLSSIPDLGNTSGILGAISGTGEAALTSKMIFDKLNVWHSDRNKFIDMQSDSGNFTGFYGDKKINALFTAMQTKKYGRILAKPKLLVDDNQQGTIETKSTTYITRTTSSTQIPDTGSPFTSTDTKFEPYDASIKLDIKPHISKGNNLRLEITLTRSDFVDRDSASTKPPDQAASDVTTVVTVPDGATIILGGMDKVNQNKGGDKIPLLGDIPLLGGLFRKTSNTSFQSKLYIFVKAHILRPGTDLTSDELIDISDENRVEFETTETEMQKYEDWPGIKPEPMDPTHILEADEPRPE
jgi:general secretion pathway protein D